MGTKEDTDFDALLKDIEANDIAAAAMEENRIRRELAEVLLSEMSSRDLDTLRQNDNLVLTKRQLKRLLHEELGGDLSLSTIFRAAKVLGYKVNLTLTKRY